MLFDSFPLKASKVTKQEFKSPFMAMCELYDKTPTDSLMSLYYEAVKELSVEQWNEAVMNVIKTNKYPSLPKPADILEGQSGDADAQAMLAIEKIKQAIRDHGPNQSIVFDDPVIHMLIDRHNLAWPGLCAMTLEEHKWLWKDWLKLYKAYTVRPVSHSKRLIGITEGENTLEAMKVNCGACQGGNAGPCQRCGGKGYINTGRNMVSYVGDKAKCLEIEGEQPKQLNGGE